MNILHLANRQPARRVEQVDALPDEGFLWLDFVREDGEDWAGEVKRLTGVVVHERHVEDSFNAQHPSYADQTQDYEMLIFRGLSPESAKEHFSSRALAYFLFDRLLVTVRPKDSLSVVLAREKVQQGKGRIPLRPVGLMHLILNAMVDRFLDLRDPLAEKLANWSRDLVDPNHPFDDWQVVLAHRNQVRKLVLLCEDQIDALKHWRDETGVDMDDHLAVRFNDLTEHVERVMRFASDQEQEVESVVQMHFSAVAHRTNEIMRVLTVISAIFLPLSFLAGIFGMNFENMPELKYTYAYYIALGGMSALAIGLLVLFRIRRWL